MSARTGSAIAAVIFFACVVSGRADPRDDALDAMNKCAAVSDDHARLACYDLAAPKVKSALAEPAPPSRPSEEQQKSWFGLPDIFGGRGGRPPQTTPREFGNEALPPPPPPPPPPVVTGQPPPPPPPKIIDSITAGVTDYAFNANGKLIVFLDNGQIWQQAEGDTDSAQHAFKKSGPNSVTISRGMIGSYNLIVNDGSRVYKVRRLR